MSLLKIAKDSVLLAETSLPKDPFTLFSSWFIEAKARLPSYQLAGAMCLSTAGASDPSVPSSRMVMMRKYDSRGFGFFTNDFSPKALDIKVSPFASLVFYWHTEDSMRTVRVEGAVEAMPEQEVLDSWNHVPKANQIQIYTSPLQSYVIPGREELDLRQAELEAQYAEASRLPLPAFWTGYRVVPRAIEFWHGRNGCAHDRFRYSRQLGLGPDFGSMAAGGASEEVECNEASVWFMERLAP